MSRLLRQMATRSQHGREDESKRLTSEERGPDDHDGALEATEVFLSERRLRRKLLYHRCALGLLSTFLAISLLSHTTFTRVASNKARLIPSPVPIFSQTITTFNRSSIFAQRPNPNSDAAWNALLPPGRGFIFVPNPETYDLSPGEATPYGPIYSTTLFHQLHCLGQLRRFTYMFLDTITSHNGEWVAAIEKMFVQGDAEEHLAHCFDYLRQGLMCNADMSLEWPRTEEDGRRFAVDGWNVPHQCVDWDEVMEYMDQHHFNMSTNAEIAPVGGSSGRR